MKEVSGGKEEAESQRLIKWGPYVEDAGDAAQ